MIEFLGFVVEQALLNQRDSINERLIGQVVFQKPSDWEPSLDSIVRSEGRRLRAKLSQYYEGLGRNDEVRIQIPKGTYVPEFSFNQDPLPKSAVETSPALAALSTPTKPSVTGLPILIAALICACLVLIVFAVSRGKTGDLNSRPAFTTASFTTDFGKEFSPAISPDGKTIAYVWDDGSGTPDIFLRGIDDKTSHRLNPIADERLFPSWSHDGQKMAFIAVRGDKLDIQIDSLKDDSLRTVVSISKAVGQWTEDSSPLLGCPGPVWSADDQSSIFEDRDTATDTSGLVKVNFNGAKEAQITSTKGEFHDLYPRWSPNGENIAFVRYSSHGVGELFITSLSGAEPARQLTQDLKTIQGLAWDHDGKQLVFASNRLGTFQLWSLRIDTHAINPLPTNTIWASEPSIASDGNWLVFVQASTNWNIWRDRKSVV